MSPLRVLILGGAGEAASLADRLAGDRRFAPTLSLAGRTRAPRLPAIEVRIGGFGGVEGLGRYLREADVGALIIALHPYADQMRRHALDAVRTSPIPVLMIERPAWRPGPLDDWRLVGDLQAAAAALGPAPRRVLLTVGRKDLSPFRAAPWHAYVIRSVDAPPPESLPRSAELILSRGPFNEAGELSLLRERRIEVIVTKNSGGQATSAKLSAARKLGLPVIMIERPPPVDASGVRLDLSPDAPGALLWLASLHQGLSGAERGV